MTPPPAVGKLVAYDAENNLESLTETVGNSTQGYDYTYDENNRITSVTVGDTTVTYHYDAFSRLTQKVTKQGETVVKTETYTFVNWTKEGDATNYTTAQVATYAVTTGGTTTTWTYTYDANGNILTISDGTHTTSYVYDSANQLVRENNQAEGYTHTWEYDDAGNILSRTEYTYTTVESLDNVTPDKTVAYAYNDATWGDLLTAYDGQNITYDGIGNPLNDGTWMYEWQRGRQLKSMSEIGGDTIWTYTYDSNGMRTGRTDGTTTYSYVYNGSQLVQMTVGTNTLRFTYDAAGTPLSVNYNGTIYYYVTNIQGDVVAIVNASGVEQVRYTYGAWGQLLSTTGTLATTLGADNPLRYRGYVYDIETGLYYLQSRYYDSTVGRFINQDAYAATGQGFVGNNMFAYCGNNPVRFYDPTGHAISTYDGRIPGMGSIEGLVASSGGGSGGAVGNVNLGHGTPGKQNLIDTLDQMDRTIADGVAQVANAIWDAYMRGLALQQEAQIRETQMTIDGVKNLYNVFNETKIIDVGAAGYNLYSAVNEGKKALSYIFVPDPSFVNEGLAIGHAFKGLYHLYKYITGAQ